MPFLCPFYEHSCPHPQPAASGAGDDLQVFEAIEEGFLNMALSSSIQTPRQAGCLSHFLVHTELPRGFLGVELFLGLFTCARPRGQGQKSAVVPASVGVGEVPAALGKLVSNTAFTLLFAAPGGQGLSGRWPGFRWALEEESHRLRLPVVPGHSSETMDKSTREGK